MKCNYSVLDVKVCVAIEMTFAKELLPQSHTDVSRAIFRGKKFPLCLLNVLMARGDATELPDIYMWSDNMKKEPFDVASKGIFLEIGLSTFCRIINMLL